MAPHFENFWQRYKRTDVLFFPLSLLIISGSKTLTCLLASNIKVELGGKGGVLSNLVTVDHFQFFPLNLNSLRRSQKLEEYLKDIGQVKSYLTFHLCLRDSRKQQF